MNSPLQMARKRLNKTLQEVARAVEIDPSNLSRIERGLQPASPKLAESLCRALDGHITEMEILYPERFQQCE